MPPPHHSPGSKFYIESFCKRLINTILIRWLYGETGCQLYGAAGFFVGIGIIISLGLIIAEGFSIIYGKGGLINRDLIEVQIFEGLAPIPRQKRHSFLMIGISWIFLMFFVIPPYLDIFGMFSIDKQKGPDLQVYLILRPLRAGAEWHSLHH